MLVTAYYAFFHSLIAYGITLWGNSSAAHGVFIWQKKAIRVIKDLQERESCVPFFKEINIMTLPSLYMYSCLVLAKENLGSFQKRQDIHNYSTRQKCMIDLLCIRLEKTRTSHVYLQRKLFNKLPEAAWLASLSKFKSTTSKWFKDKAFYTVEQFLNCDTSDMKF